MRNPDYEITETKVPYLRLLCLGSATRAVVSPFLPRGDVLLK
jgi:hypothetical protein